MLLLLLLPLSLSLLLLGTSLPWLNKPENPEMALIPLKMLCRLIAVAAVFAFAFAWAFEFEFESVTMPIPLIMDNTGGIGGTTEEDSWLRLRLRSRLVAVLVLYRAPV